MRDISAVEMQLRLSINSPALLEAVMLLLPLAVEEYGAYIDGPTVGCPPLTVAEMQRKGEKWLEGIMVAEQALAAIRLPAPTLFLLHNQVDAQLKRGI
jgi:hypothetical protein